MSLRRGSKGEEVRRLQENLKALDLYPHKIDSDFGRRTLEAVLVFQERHFVDGIVDKKTEDAVEKAVVAWANREREILVPIPHGLKQIEDQFGKIEYEEVGGGYVRITNKFADDVVSHDFPVVGVQCFHRDAVPALEAVMEQIKDRGLDGLIKQFGTWCPRHKMHDPKRGLSTHSWGIAVDINWATNAPGTRGDMDTGIVAVFERYGFEWGGRWSLKDPMHFQYATGH